MNKFSDFVNNDSHNKSNNGDGKQNSDYLKAKIDEYSGCSQDKLMSDFLKLTIEKRRRGNLPIKN